jgi:4-diphosphocytidyl-2-C-methyl-D-erythritol kinase
MKIRIKAPAKINLFLEVKSKRTDGYHNIETIMQTISLYDKLSFELTKDKISFSCNNKSIPGNRSNIVYMAAHRVKKHFNIKNGVKIYLKKKIPVGAGLGGGSSDAAATLKALVKLWKIKFSRHEIEKIAAKLGSDVTFFLTGGIALCKGKGELVTPLRRIDKLKVILVNPGYALPTVEMYKKIKLPLTNTRKLNRIMPSICNNSFNTKKAFDTCFNRFEKIVSRNNPEIVEIKKTLNDLGCSSFVSGSGATVFGILDPGAKVKNLKFELKKHKWKIYFVNTI